MNKLLSIDPAVLERLRKLSKSEKVECLLALSELSDSFGKPHMHSGIGFRKLGGKLFEFRGTLSLRFLFQDRSLDLYVSFLGSHDEIKAMLRSGKYR